MRSTPQWAACVTQTTGGPLPCANSLSHLTVPGQQRYLGDYYRERAGNGFRTISLNWLKVTTDACTSYGAGGFSSKGKFYSIKWWFPTEGVDAQGVHWRISINMLELLASVAFLTVVPFSYLVVSRTCCPTTAVLSPTRSRTNARFGSTMRLSRPFILGEGRRTAAQGALARMNCRNRLGNMWLKELAWLQWGKPLRVFPKRISTENNKCADGLSRYAFTVNFVKTAAPTNYLILS